MSSLVTLEQSKLLKELGYNEPTREYYESSGYLITQNESRFILKLKRNSELSTEYSAPTVSEALDYLREEKGIACGCHPYAIYEDMPDGDQHFVKWGYKYVAFQGLSEWQNMNKEVFDTHPLANSALLSAVLEYLIEKEK